MMQAWDYHVQNESEVRAFEKFHASELTCAEFFKKRCKIFPEIQLIPDLLQLPSRNGNNY